jgi:cytochrome c biogenesis protein CcmG, thiol:disulfide interchange protein DsbE
MNVPEQRRILAALWVIATAAVVFALISFSMATSGGIAALRESAIETGAEWVDRPLTDELDGLSGLEAAPWHRPGDAPARVSAAGGGLVLVCFWASYCEPCRREWPSMLRLAREMGEERLRVVAVTYDEKWDAAEAFFRRFFGYLPPAREAILLRDRAGEPEEMLKTRYGTDKIPETYVVGRGRVLFRFVNERDWTDPRMLRFFERLEDVR